LSYLTLRVKLWKQPAKTVPNESKMPESFVKFS